MLLINYHVKSQAHNKLYTWHLGANAYLLKSRLWFFPPQSDYKDDYQEYWKFHDRKVTVHPKGINRSMGAMQAKLNIDFTTSPDSHQYYEPALGGY